MGPSGGNLIGDQAEGPGERDQRDLSKGPSGGTRRECKLDVENK